MLPLFHAFRHPYALEIFLTSDGQIQFQIALHDDDAGVLAHLRTLYGSHLTAKEQSVEAWNVASGLGADSSLAYLLPESSLYPLSFALAWKDADVVALVMEQLKTMRRGPLLVQLLVAPEPDAGRGIATDVLAAASHLGGRVEAFRLGLIRERFNCPLARFALRLLAPTDGTLKPLINSLCVLAAPFNRLRAVTLSRAQTREVSEAVLERRVGLSDGTALISLPELAGLWHLPLQADYLIERALVREVATARLSRVNEPGRILGFHSLRGDTQPVVLPYSTRNNHFCCFGRSQSGKSTALARIAAADIAAGLGLAIIDQHDLPSRVLPHIPPERWDDVVLISPRRMASHGRAFPLNLFDLGHKDAFAVEFVCETLKEILGRAFSAESIGPRTSYIFDIAVTALLRDPAPRAPYTVLDLSRVLLDKHFRAELAERQDDADTRDKLLGFDALPKDSFAAPLNKLQLFSRHSIRPMIAARENGFNTVRARHASLLDAKPIIICDLADIPHASAVVIGSIVLSLVQLEAFKRDPQGSHDIFHCYIDEAGAFLNLENADLITRTLQECAKFRMSLGLINQSYETIPPVVRKTLSTNVGALMYFAMGIGSGDAKIAAAELHGEFTEDELNRLPVGRAALRLGGEVFSVASPDFKNPSNDHSAALIAHSLESKGVAVPTNNESNLSPASVIAQSLSAIPQRESAHTAESGGERMSATAVNPKAAAQAPTPARSRVKLADLQGQTKQMAVLRLLAVAGLVPLADLSELFFPGSPEYGRQFLKTMAGDELLAFVKLGKRLAYHLSPHGFAVVCKSGKKAQAFALPEERLLEHAALVGAVATRFCAQAARAGLVLDAERESPWQGARPDLRASWQDEAGGQFVLVECDRSTESKATFVREKLVPYERAFASLRPNAGARVRLLVIVTEAERAAELCKAARESPSLKEVLRFVVITDWPVNTDLEAIPHTEEKWRKR